MYAIIYWTDDNSVYPLTNPDETLMLFENVKGADHKAFEIEELSKGQKECRVINIERVEN